MNSGPRVSGTHRVTGRSPFARNISRWRLTQHPRAFFPGSWATARDLRAFLRLLSSCNHRSMQRWHRPESMREAGGKIDVEIHGFQQLFLCDLLIRGVGYVDGAGAEEEGFAPGGERRDIGGELGDHGGEVADPAHADEAEAELEGHAGA